MKSSDSEGADGQDAGREPTFATPTGEPRAGTEPGGGPGPAGAAPDAAHDTVAEDPGSAGDTADVEDEGQPAVTPADPAAGESRH